MLARIRNTEIYFDVGGAALVPDGMRMRERPTAMLLHGGPGGDHTAFKRRPGYRMLKDRLQLVYFDYRGQGRSARGDPLEYTLDEDVLDMEGLRRHLGLGPVISIGVSYGGIVALAHAARYPSAVSHLIIAVTTSHSGYVHRARQIVAERGTAEQRVQCDELFSGCIDSPEKMRRFFEVMGPLYSLKFDREQAILAGDPTVYTPEALNRAHGPDGFLRKFDLRPELHAITAPTLIIAGRHDWISAPEFSEEIHRLISGSDLRIFEESAHAVASDEPENFANVIAGFLVYKERMLAR